MGSQAPPKMIYFRGPLEKQSFQTKPPLPLLFLNPFPVTSASEGRHPGTEEVSEQGQGPARGELPKRCFLGLPEKLTLWKVATEGKGRLPTCVANPCLTEYIIYVLVSTLSNDRGL